SYTIGLKPLLNRSRQVWEPMYPAPPTTRIFCIASPRGQADACVASQNKVDQSLVTYGTTGRKISNKPQPRKPSHAIIAIAIVATSRPMTIRRFNAPREEPDLIRGSLRSIGLRLFIGAV